MVRWLAVVLLMTHSLWSAGASPVEEESQRVKIGLVLSGGGARGAAHVGVIKVLDEMNIPIDYIAGTSMGAIVGGLYASGVDARELERIVSGADWSRLLSDRAPRAQRTIRRKAGEGGFLVDFQMGVRDGKLVFPKGLVQGHTLSLELRKLLSKVATIDDFDKLPIPFRAIAADIETGEQLVLAKGDLAKSIRASMSVPGAFRPVEIDNHVLVDGGIVNNLPIDVVKEMGADVVIVVDVGTSPADKEALDSPLKITSQMLTILIKQQSEQQKRLMSDRDFLLAPELGGISSTAFQQVARAAQIGEQAAREARAGLTRYSIPKAAYLSYRRSLELATTDAPIISRVTIDNRSRLATEILQRGLSNLLDAPLNFAVLEQDLQKLYAYDTFSALDYSLRNSTSGYELDIVAESKDWGPNYLRLGINLEDNFEGDSDYNLAARLIRTEINRLGGELRADMVIGDSPELALEFYQPLDTAARWFVNPRLQYQSTSSGSFLDGQQLALLRSDDTSLSLGIGRNIGVNSELRLSAARLFSRSDVQIGTPDTGSATVDIDSVGASFLHDSIDRVAIPRAGQLLAMSWSRLHDLPGSDSSVDIARLDYLKPITVGKHTLLNWWSLGSVINAEPQVDFNAFSLGGLFNLSGITRGELVGQNLLMGRAVYYRRMGRGLASLIDTPVYLGASLEVGNVWQDRRDISLDTALVAGSVFVVVDSVVGPLYVAYGVSEDDRSSAYLFLGQTF